MYQCLCQELINHMSLDLFLESILFHYSVLLEVLNSGSESPPILFFSKIVLARFYVLRISPYLF